MTFKTVTRNYIRNSSRRAFTLVELLVVIAIISILVGLLMPAVMNAQNEARRAQCQENLRNVAMALVNFESSKNYFPGYKAYFNCGHNTGVSHNPDTYNTNNPCNSATWYHQILMQLGNSDLYKQYITMTSGNYKTLKVNIKDNKDSAPHLSVFNCPSDSRIKCKQSYRINGGMDGANGNDKKWRSTGLSFDLTGSARNDLKVGLSQIVDGAANTILVGENSNSRSDWMITDLSIDTSCLRYATATDWGTQAIINRDMDSTSVDLKHSRPSSRHRGVALVAFADTHVLSLKDSIQYNTYKMIMCPNDNGTSANININNIDNNYP